MDSNPAGTAEAFKYTATATGTVKRLSVYLDAASTATSVHLDLYTNATDGKPRKLLTSGRITNPVAGTWNTVSVPATAVKAASDYWLAVLAPVKAGTVKFRDRPDGNGGPTQTSAQKSLKSLPGSWVTGNRFANAPASLYATTG